MWAVGAVLPWASKKAGRLLCKAIQDPSLQETDLPPCKPGLYLDYHKEND